MLSLTFIAYISALLIKNAAETKQKKILAFIVFLLLIVLCYFKYFGAFIIFMKSFGLSQIPNSFVNILIPIGISYYIFRLISYVVDVYWDTIPAEKDFFVFAGYTAFFPHILSGPIQRAPDYLSQIKNLHKDNTASIAEGIWLILFGFFKKLVVADHLAVYVNAVFNSPSNFDTLSLVIASYGFAFQLYADFSGFTDIAIGTAKLFGISSPQNFDNPFYAPNIQVFWRKWHMSLTFWLRDYLFTPLQMKLRFLGFVGLYLCVLINMLAIGIWHGPKVTYLLFGLLHSFFIITSLITLKKRDNFFESNPVLNSLRKIFAPLITFHLVVFALIFFRANIMNDAILILFKIIGVTKNTSQSISWNHVIGTNDMVISSLSVLVMEFVHLRRNKNSIALKPLWHQWLMYWALALLIFLFGVDSTNQFIYFKF